MTFAPGPSSSQRVSPVQGERQNRSRILRAGSNCSVIAVAERAAVLVDGAEYFEWLEKALLNARCSIIIAGWDFDGRIALNPTADKSRTLGWFLRSLVESHPGLEVRILVWNVGVVHAPGAAGPLLFGAEWQDHPRLHVRLDSTAPVQGAHHQKIVCIDELIAFVGGIDLTVDRWDTRSHRHNEPHRTTPDDESCPPVHDAQLAVDADAAREVAAIARRRWTAATGEDLQPRPTNSSAWPAELAPQFRDVEIGVACTSSAAGSDGR